MYWKGPKFGSVYGVALKLALEIYFSTSRQNGRVGALLVSHLTNFLWERFNFHSECARTFEYVLKGSQITLRIWRKPKIDYSISQTLNELAFVIGRLWDLSDKALSQLVFYYFTIIPPIIFNTRNIRTKSPLEVLICQIYSMCTVTDVIVPCTCTFTVVRQTKMFTSLLL